MTSERSIVERIFGEFVAGKTMTAIAKGLNDDRIPPRKARIWRQATISNILRNPVFVGKVKYDGEVYEGQHEPIISEELSAKARQLLEARPSKGKGRPPKGPHLLRNGMLVCGDCGEKMYPLRDLYECSGRFGGCDAGAVLRRNVDEAILGYFERDALDLIGTQEALIAARDSRLAEAREQRERADVEGTQAVESMTRIRADYKRGAITAADWDDFREELEEEQSAALAESMRWQEREAEIEAEAGAIDRYRARPIEKAREHPAGNRWGGQRRAGNGCGPGSADAAIPGLCPASR